MTQDMAGKYWDMADRVHPDYSHRDRSLPWNILDNIWFMIAQQKFDNLFKSQHDRLMELIEIGDALL